MTDESLRLRLATSQDAYALWLWANDPETRAASYARPVIPWAEHVRWLRGQLESPSAVILIAETGYGQPSGSARFNTTDEWATARLSYVMSPEVRGRGWSRQMIALATDWLPAHPPPAVVVAEVMTYNERSLRLFRALGWQESFAAEADVYRFQYSRRPR